jgi:formylglycine-generating enzyme required for sulfatase activity/tRNA A-37 threonylcarbamoyl transferase component Bud32
VADSPAKNGKSGGNNGGKTDATLPPDPEPAAASPSGKVSTAEFGPGEPDPDLAVVHEADLDVLAVGAMVGRYIVVERLGAGAMGVVYAAYDPKLDRKVALKLLRPAPGSGDQARRTARLEREAQAVAKLSHPNVVGIFDVLVFEERVVLAMEYLAGGTLRAWMDAKKRSWREIVAMFIEVGKGLAAAHAAGQIHRDFKPDNVLLDANGVPKVADFGLARTRTTAGAQAAVSTEDDVHSANEQSGELSEAHLTRTGAIAGTPAYMAPEQFLGKPVDERTDQFAFCVALYEALYGQRPFAGDTVLRLASSVTEGRIQPPPKDVAVPSWIRQSLLRGLTGNSAQRYRDIGELVDVLSTDPVRRRRRWLLTTAAVAILAAAAFWTQDAIASRRREIRKQVAEHLQSGTASLLEARRKAAAADDLRRRALAAFDGFNGTAGEDLWSAYLSLTREVATGYSRAIQRFEAATTLAPSAELKGKTADALVDYVRLAEAPKYEREAATRKLAQYDDGSRRLRELTAPARIALDTSTEHVTVALQTYDDVSLTLSTDRRTLGRTPLVTELAAGSYRFLFEGTAKHVAFALPVLLTAGEKFDASIPVPSPKEVPAGFVYVPPGRFLFGSADEEIRAVFLETVPLHEIRTKAFLVCDHETTIGEWLRFLDDLPRRERDLHRPRGRMDATAGYVDVRKDADGKWALRLRPTVRTYEAVEGETVHYVDRDRRAVQDWRRFPVSGISPEDANRYVRWLNESGQVPGARLCTESEWERVARGADARRFPHGQSLRPDDANFDLTYGRKDAAFGPDEVKSHPASRSPFDVDDMVGNVWEIVLSVLDRGQYVTRGGSFYQSRPSNVSANRNPISPITRDHTIGLRVCADVRL